MKISQPLIPLEQIEDLVQIEPALVLLGLTLIAGLFYKFFLKNLSPERHTIIRNHFKNLMPHVFTGSIFFLIYHGMSRVENLPPSLSHLLPYVGFAAIISGIIVFVKVSRIFISEYLFFSHMKVAVPLLLIDLFTMFLYLVSAAWLATAVFNVRLAPVLATSAILSVVLGFALQDLLGNLFAGVALQFDKPYEIGDWIEINYDGQVWVGQVREISWRATLLIGFQDQTITISNRMMGQAQISNFTTKHHPIYRAHNFRVAYRHPSEQVKKLLADAISTVPTVRKEPKPYAIINETHESWLQYRLIYLVDSYGSQYIIADEVITACLKALRANGIEIAPAKILVAQQNEMPQAH
jgi:small-conductance mechanosensitive channel